MGGTARIPFEGDDLCQDELAGAIPQVGEFGRKREIHASSMNGSGREGYCRLSWVKAGPAPREQNARIDGEGR